MPEGAKKRIDTVNRFLQMNISKETELQQIVELAAKICEVPIAMITFINSDTQFIRFKVGTDLAEIPFQDTMCKHTIIQKNLLVIADTSTDERVKDNFFVANDPNIRFYAGSPLTTHDNDTFGTLCVYDTEPKILTATQEKMLHRLSHQVSRLLEFEACFELLKEQYESSILEETKLRSFFESSSSCHLLLDKQLVVLSFNSTMLNVLKNSYHRSITEGMHMSDYVEPAFIKEFTAHCNSALLGEHISIERHIQSPTGNICWHLTFEPAYDSSRLIIGVTYCATDITETVHQEQTVAEQGESLRQINRIMSAELSRPLATISRAMNSINVQGYPGELIEFQLLDRACNELAEKGALIISPDTDPPAPAIAYP